MAASWSTMIGKYPIKRHVICIWISTLDQVESVKRPGPEPADPKAGQLPSFWWDLCFKPTPPHVPSLPSVWGPFPCLLACGSVPPIFSGACCAQPCQGRASCKLCMVATALLEVKAVALSAACTTSTIGDKACGQLWVWEEGYSHRWEGPGQGKCEWGVVGGGRGAWAHSVPPPHLERTSKGQAHSVFSTFWETTESVIECNVKDTVDIFHKYSVKGLILNKILHTTQVLNIYIYICCCLNMHSFLHRFRTGVYMKCTMWTATSYGNGSELLATINPSPKFSFICLFQDVGTLTTAMPLVQASSVLVSFFFLCRTTAMLAPNPQPISVWEKILNRANSSLTPQHLISRGSR